MASYIQARGRTRAPKTVQGDVEQLDLFLRWLVARAGVGARCDLLSRALLEDYDRHLAQRGHRKPLSPGSRRQVLGQLCTWWRWAYDRDEWDGLIPRPRRVELAVVVPPTVHAPDWTMMDGVIGAAVGETLRRAAVLLRCLGWRVSQICRLRTEDVDFVRETIALRGELGKSRREKSGRVVPLPPELALELRTWQLRPGRALVAARPSAVRVAIRKAWRASGAPEVYWTGRPDHAFRKGWRSEMRLRGAAHDAIEFWCGRRTGDADTYTDPRALPLVELARMVPPLPARAQGAPMMRLLFGADRAAAA